MGKRDLTPEDEQRLIDEVWDNRDNDAYWDFNNPLNPERNATLTLPIDLTLDQVRSLRRRAASQGLPLSEFMAEAISSLADAYMTVLGLAEDFPLHRRLKLPEICLSQRPDVAFKGPTGKSLKP